MSSGKYEFMRWRNYPQDWNNLMQEKKRTWKKKAISAIIITSLYSIYIYYHRSKVNIFLVSPAAIIVKKKAKKNLFTIDNIVVDATLCHHTYTHYRHHHQHQRRNVEVVFIAIRFSPPSVHIHTHNIIKGKSILMTFYVITFMSLWLVWI